MTRGELQTLQYRRERFVRVAQRLEQRLLGLDRLVEPFTRDEAGAYSEEKTQALAGALARDSLYFGMLPYDRKMTPDEQDWDIERFCTETFEDLEPLCRDFYYCALRMQACAGLAWQLELPQVFTFADFLPMARQIIYEGREEDKLIESTLAGNAPTFFALADYHYAGLTCVDPLDALTVHREKIPGGASTGSHRVRVAEADLERLDAMPHKEEFIRAYGDFRRGWFSNPHAVLEEFLKAVEWGPVIYLARSGLTYLGDEDYFPAYGLMTWTEQQLAKLLGGED